MPFNITFGSFASPFSRADPSGNASSTEGTDNINTTAPPLVPRYHRLPSPTPRRKVSSTRRRIPGSYSFQTASSSSPRLENTETPALSSSESMSESSTSADGTRNEHHSPGLPVAPLAIDYYPLYDEEMDISGESMPVGSINPVAVRGEDFPPAAASSNPITASSITIPSHAVAFRQIQATNPTPTAGPSSSTQGLKRRNSGTDLTDSDDDAEIAADGSYRFRTKLRFIEDPRLLSQVSQLFKQLDEERARVNLLTSQLNEAQQGRVETAWVARGVFDNMALQSNDLSRELQVATRARDLLERELADIAQVLGAAPNSDGHVMGLGEGSSSNTLSGQAVTSHPILQAARALRAETQQYNGRLSALHTEAMQASQASSQLLTAALTERDDARQRLEQVSQNQQRMEHEYQQRLQRELEERLRQERQELSQQMGSELEQRLQESNQAHERSLHSEVARIQAEHRQQIAERLVQVRQEVSQQLGSEFEQRIQERDEAHEHSLRDEVNRVQVEYEQQVAESTRNRERLEARLCELERQAQESHLARSQLQESTNTADIIATLRGEIETSNRRVEQLETRIASQTPQIPTETPEQPAQSLRPIAAGPSQPPQTPETHSGLSARAREKLPADPRLAKIRASSMMQPRDSARHRVSFSDDDHPIETITPPLRISRPYTSSAPRAPCLRLPTSRSVSPVTPTLASRTNRQPSSLRHRTPIRLASPSPPNSPMRPSTTQATANITPTPDSGAVPGSWMSDESDDDGLRSPYSRSVGSQRRMGEHLRSPHVPAMTYNSESLSASQGSVHPPEPISQPDPIHDLPSILGNLAGAVNTLREELTETRNVISTMSSPTNQASSSRRTSRSARNSPYKSLPASRLNEQSRVDMMKVVRDEIKTKLGINQDKDIHRVITNNRHMASPREVDNFDAGLVPPPPLSPLRPYWDDIHCPWNESLASRFADEIMARHRLAETKDKVKEHIFQRLITLKKELKRCVPRLDETPSQARERADAQHQITLARGRVQNRQTTLFHTRKQICEEGLKRPDRAIWESLLRLVLALQTEGQSSDETEDEVADVFHVRTRPWRNQSITKLLKYIDSHRDTTNNYGNRRSGKPFRTRLRVARPPLTHDRPIAGLPQNCYSDVFFNSRRQDQLEHLGAQDPIVLPEFYNDADDE